MWDYNTIFSNFLIVAMVILLVDGLFSIVINRKRKRINKISGSLVVWLFNIAMVFKGAPIYLSSHQIVLAIVGILILWMLFRHYIGVKYSVDSTDQQNILESIETAIRVTEGADFQKVEEDETVKFSMAGTSRAIVLIKRESPWSLKKIYEIKFKQWINYETKRDILDLMENSLSEESKKKKGKVGLVLETLMIIILMIVALFITSKWIMEPDGVAMIAFEEMPAEVYLVKTDDYYTNDEVIFKLQHYLKNAYSTKSNKIHHLYLEDAGVILKYNPQGNNIQGRKIYMGELSGFLFVPHSEIGNKSPFHRIFWRVNQIYNKEEGNYYHLFMGEKKWQDLYEEIINSDSDREK